MYDLDDSVKLTIIDFAKAFNLSKVILFGSRARGTNSPRSDIDLAVSGGDIRNFRFAIDEELPSLLLVDVVNLDQYVNKDLHEEILRDGVILYEKV